MYLSKEVSAQLYVCKHTSGCQNRFYLQGVPEVASTQITKGEMRVRFDSWLPKYPTSTVLRNDKDDGWQQLGKEPL